MRLRDETGETAVRLKHVLGTLDLHLLASYSYILKLGLSVFGIWPWGLSDEDIIEWR